MENAFSRLLKVLILERKQGYRNKAVIGGLDKFASRWEVEARATTARPTLVDEIVALLIGYPSVEAAEARERIIDQIVRRAREAEAQAGGISAPEAPALPAEPPIRPPRPAEPAPGKPAVAGGERGREPAAPSKTESREAGQGAQAEAARRPAAPSGPWGIPPAKPAVRTPAQDSDTLPREAGPARAKPGMSKPEPGQQSGAKATPQAEGPAAPAEPASSEMAQAAKPAPPGPEESATTPARIDEPAPADRDAGPAVPESDALEGWLGPAAVPPSVQPGEALDLTGQEEAGAAAGEPDAAYQPGAWAYGAEEPGFDEPAGASLQTQAQLQVESGPGRGLDASVLRLPGIGPSLAEKLGRLGVHTVRDLLFLLPRRYDDYSQLATIDRLRYGDEVTIVATIWQLGSRPLSEGRKMVTAVAGDGTGEIQMIWFNPYIERQLHTGRPFVFSGKVDSFRGQLQMKDPVFEPLDSLQTHTGRLVPIYPLTQGLSARWLRKLMRSTVTTWAAAIPDPVPASIRQEWELVPMATALNQIHFPESTAALAAARRRLTFDEFFFLQLGVLGYRRRFRGLTAHPLAAGPDVLEPFLANLPFAMTGAQQRVLDEIARDLAGAEPMSRLLQGDVGSGKTAVAAAALWAAVVNGTQGAIMAPTEILAEQHARSFEKLFAGLARPGAGRPVQVALLTGRQRKTERDALLAGLAQGEIDIAVGTHALIQEDVEFRELTVAVVDEQHRFGVEQRSALRQKGAQPHLLVMSATPIPRSLALTLYGDLDVSVIDEMPAGRAPVKTKWLTSTYRERGYNFIRRQVEAGHQAFIIYPLVEESDRSETKAAVEEHARLQSSVFPNFRLGLLHGRLPGDEKDAVMRAFAAGELDILVATSVVEVGIDVPNATVIMIEGAERFGLAQLHQFRGRVGRGPHASYCILISDAGEGESAQRLQALESNHDGFALAQIDLDLRGPGDFLGTRQSGLPPLRMAVQSDLRTLEDARAAAQRLFAQDPQLARPEHQLLAGRVAEFWHGAGDVS